ncbi:MAG: hypothetical protein RL077_2850 [Verrucomicrobiota bacterium]|jgi:drug/metabolite transporter (DMT)-like permease
MLTHRSAERTRALGMLLLANFFWGLSFPVIKALMFLQAQLLPGVDPWFLTVYTVGPRFVLATLIMLVVSRGCWRATQLEWQQGVIMGLFAAGGMLFQNDGLQYTEASTSAFLTQLYAILIPVWAAVGLRRNPGARVWMCCGLVLAGVVILGRFNWSLLRFGRGEWETLVSSVFFMVQILTLGRADFYENRPERISFVMFLTQAIVLGGLVGYTAPNREALVLPWTSVSWVGLTVTLTVFCTIGATVLMNRWQPKITTIEAGLIYCVEPIFGSLLALFLPALFSAGMGIAYANEDATWRLLVGGGVITLANIYLQFRPAEKR